MRCAQRNSESNRFEGPEELFSGLTFFLDKDDPDRILAEKVITLGGGELTSQKAKNVISFRKRTCRASRGSPGISLTIPWLWDSVTEYRCLPYTDYI